MKHLADSLKFDQPLLEYAYGYALNNWKLVNDPNPTSDQYSNDDLIPNLDKPLDNMQMIRKFTGCGDESGFMLLHVAIDSRSHLQAQAYEKMFEGANKKDR